jgi:hypothetical protein
MKRATPQAFPANERKPRWDRNDELDEDDDAHEAREHLERAQARVAALRKDEGSEAEADLSRAIENERLAAEEYLRHVPSAISEEEKRRRGERAESRTEKALRQLDEDRVGLIKADQATQERARWAKASLGREYLQKSVVSALSDPAAAAAIDRIRQIEGNRGA